MGGGVSSQTTTGTLSDPSHRFSQVASSGCAVPTFTSFDSTAPRGRRRTIYALLSKKACGVGRWPWPHHACCRCPVTTRQRGSKKKKKDARVFVCGCFSTAHRTCCVLCGASWGCTSVVYCIVLRIERRGPAAGSRRSIRSSNCYIFFSFFFVYF